MATLGHGPERLAVPKTSPEQGCERPVSIRSRVDLPEPEGPKARISPG